MRGRLLGVLWLAACYSPHPQAGARCASGQCPTGLVCSPATDTCEVTAVAIDSPAGAIDAPTSIDAAVVADARGDGTAQPACYGNGLVSICPSQPVTSTLSISNAVVIDTDASTMCIAYSGGSSLCVLAGTSVTLTASGSITATGSRPLVLLSTGAMTIAGTIDVASHLGGATGAGANPTSCAAGATPTARQGGAGGSFGGVGGSGGGTLSGLGPAAGSAASTIASVRGGCSGGNGEGGAGGAGGAGGGAFYAIAASSISITGTINASGAGGAHASTPGGGGGGGGAGGFIGLDAPAISASGAIVFANGGGGGEGATPHKQGAAGADPSSPVAPANGGAGGVKKGGDGGHGSVGAMLTGADATAGGVCDLNAASGGGGGGGAGVIRTYPTQSLGGTVSPPPT